MIENVEVWFDGKGRPRFTTEYLELQAVNMTDTLEINGRDHTRIEISKPYGFKWRYSPPRWKLSDVFDAVCDALLVARSEWVRVSERLPTDDDADDNLMVQVSDGEHVYTVFGEDVHMFKFWRKAPSAPDVR